MNKKILGIVAAVAVVVIGGAFMLKGNNATNNNDSTEVKEIVHTLGTTKIEGTPAKVVTLDYGVLDALDALGVDVVGLPKSGTIPSYLSKFEDDKYGNAGSVKEPDLEAIHALEPDVIFMSGRMADYYEELSEIAPTIYVESDGAKYIETFTNAMNMYGEVFSVKDKAVELVNEIDGKVSEVKSKVEGLNTNASVIMLNGRAISAFGAGSRYGLIFNELGFAQVDETLVDSSHGQEISFEYIVDKNPGYLFVVDRNTITGSTEISATEVIENELVKQTDAYNNGNIVYLDSVTWYTVSGGYQSTLSMIDEVNNAIK